MKIQGQKIYIGNKNLLDIESIYENHPEITCRLLIEENLAKENVENKIKEALQNYPKLSGLNFQVKINEENKKTQWFNNEQDAMEYLNKSEFGNKYKKFFECDKDELIKSYEIYFKEDFVDLCFLSDNLKK